MTKSIQNPYLNFRDETNESNNVMIRQRHATMPISNDGLIRLNGLVSQFPVYKFHLMN
jgi:hypothetical protein